MIADKLTTIAENTPKVYDKGYEDGKNSVNDFCKYAKSITFSNFNVFDKPEVELTLNNLTTLYNFIYPSRSVDEPNKIVEHFTLNSTGVINDASYAFACASSTRNEVLKRLTLNVDLSNTTEFRAMFSFNVALKIIDGIPLNFKSADMTYNYATANVFYSCNALEEVRFAEKSIPKSLSFSDSPNLSTDTRQSIIDGLADLTGGTAQTLTVHKTVGKKLTDEQKATITAKNWTLVY